MHSSSDSMFAFGTNLGTLKIADLRVSASSDNTALNFKIDTPPQKNFFTDMISGYSSTEFIKQGRYLAARDYLSVKVWDVCNTKKPILNVSIQESIKSKLCELF